jgi:hypothetical protein
MYRNPTTQKVCRYASANSTARISTMPTVAEDMIFALLTFLFHKFIVPFHRMMNVTTAAMQHNYYLNGGAILYFGVHPYI